MTKPSDEKRIGWLVTEVGIVTLCQSNSLWNEVPPRQIEWWAVKPGDWIPPLCQSFFYDGPVEREDMECTKKTI